MHLFVYKKHLSVLLLYIFLKKCMTCHMHNLDKQLILINVKKKDEDKLEVLQLCDCIKIVFAYATNLFH